MAKKRTATPRENGKRDGQGESKPPQNDELIVVMRADMGIRTTRAGLEYD